jgi:hypothetical protein
LTLLVSPCGLGCGDAPEDDEDADCLTRKRDEFLIGRFGSAEVQPIRLTKAGEFLHTERRFGGEILWWGCGSHRPPGYVTARILKICKI